MQKLQQNQVGNMQTLQQKQFDKSKLSPKVASYEAKPGEVKKVVLLYSGGLDTSVMLKWIQDIYGAELIALTIDIGQPGEDLEETRQKALKLGAAKAFIVDAKKEFASEYVSKAIKANGLYEGKYPLGTSIARPLLAKKAVEIAEKEHADAIAHGCTGKGNDQVRIDLGVITLNPKLKIIAPVREWSMTRDAEIEYAKENGIPVKATSMKPYSTDENLWGKSSECGVIDNPAEMPPDNVFEFVTLPENAPNYSEIVTLEFEKGIPIALNGQVMHLHELIVALNKIAAQHGVGIIDHMEDRIIGLKSREVYEYPAATCIIEAHKDLEKYVSTLHENHFKATVDNQWAFLAYAGLWHEPLMQNLNAFIDTMNEKVTGTVKLKLYKGHCGVVARDSKFGIYNSNLSHYNIGNTFNQLASPGFIELWGLQSRMAYQLKKEHGEY